VLDAAPVGPEPAATACATGARAAWPGRAAALSRLNRNNATAHQHGPAATLLPIHWSEDMSTIPALQRVIAVPLVALFACCAVQAQQPPRSFVASPDIYKVVAQNEQFKVIAVTWQPGQKDALHSHPASAVYYLTDCSVRLHAPDGSYRDYWPKAGNALVQAPIPAHVFQNVGTSECRMVMFEPA
jgi:hypothetical protein